MCLKKLNNNFLWFNEYCMSELRIICNNQSFLVRDQDIIQLELKLNLTDEGYLWGDIGDHIYNFHNLKNYANQPSDILEVDLHQYNFLFELKDKTYGEVYKEKWGHYPIKN